jgi:hypothetical protein
MSICVDKMENRQQLIDVDIVNAQSKTITTG